MRVHPCLGLGHCVIIVWQRFCEPARLRIAHCLCFRLWVVRHLNLTRMYLNSCKHVDGLEVCSSLSPWHYFFSGMPPKGPPGGVPIPLVSMVMFSCCAALQHWSSVPAAAYGCTSKFIIWRENGSCEIWSCPLVSLMGPGSGVVKNVFQFLLIFAHFCSLIYPFARQAVRWGPFIGELTALSCGSPCSAWSVFNVDTV